MLKPDILKLFNTAIVSSSLFLEVEAEDEENKEIVSGPIIDIYDVAFIKCNTRSHAYTVKTTDKLFATNIFLNTRVELRVMAHLPFLKFNHLFLLIQSLVIV